MSTIADRQGNLHSSDDGRFTEKTNSKPSSAMRATASPDSDRPRGTRFAPGDLGPYRLRGYRSMRGEETPAFEGKLVNGSTVLASVYSEGRGGAPLMHPMSRAAHDELQAYIRGPWAAASDRHGPLGEEDFLFALSEEAQTSKELAAVRRKGRVAVMNADHVAQSRADGGLSVYITVDAGGDAAKAIEDLRASAAMRGGYYYDYDAAEWQPFGTED